MKILYAIQGTGNGHISCAREILPILQRKGEVDVLISGTQSALDLPGSIRYCLQGLSFIFGKDGGIDYLATFAKSNIQQFFRDIQQLPVQDYDLVLNDFEPVSAWACRLKNKWSVGIGHQAAVIGKNAPKPYRSDLIGQAVLKYYAPVNKAYGFHFLPYDEHTYSPVIRQEIRNLSPSNEGYYTVYLPAYSDKHIIKLLSLFPDISWHVFSKETNCCYQWQNISFLPISSEKFIERLAGAAGVLCGAGFQTPAEVLFLQKKLIVVPMRGQYEQQCNAAALKELGVPVLKNIKRKQFQKLHDWIRKDQLIVLNFPDQTEQLINDIIQANYQQQVGVFLTGRLLRSEYSFRKLFLRKLFLK